MPAADRISFLRRGRIVSVKPPSPTQTVLEYLRLDERSMGTKEGCNEGDCGACTVAIGSLKDGKLIYEPMNACIMLMGHLHGRELVTVDDLAQDGALHPVQQAMVEAHASQCGFCTPGFVMALFTLHHQGKAPTRQEIADHLAGNLCRCTGYRPIIDAGVKACNGKPADKWAREESQSIALLQSIGDDNVFVGDENSFIAIPADADELANLAAKHPDATLVSGATDVGLWITKQMRDLPRIIHTGRVENLRKITKQEDRIVIGAAATYADAQAALAEIDTDLGEAIRRIGSKQVRAAGTIGGNIANGSPIGDMPPMLITLGATLELRYGDKTRKLPVENFFIAYGKQNRAPGELVWSIEVPRLGKGEHFRAYKISKRFDQDISAVMAAFKFTVENARITAARIAFGGMAATPKRAAKTEVMLQGLRLDEPEQWDHAIAALADDFTPITDMRASSAYRMQTAQALLRKALMEIAGEPAQSRIITRRLEPA